MSINKLQGITGNVFSIGKTSDQVAIRNNSGVIQAQDFGGSWQNILGQSSTTYTITNVSTNYSVLTTDQVLLCTSGSGGITLTLPAASSMTGKQLIIKKVDSGAGALVVDGNSSETIDGALTQTISSQYAYMILVSNGTSWFIVGGGLWS